LEPARAALTQISQFVISVLLVLIIFIIGWVISRVIKGLVVKSLKVVKFDELSRRIQLDSLLEKGGIPYSLSELIGVVFYWLALLITLMVAINAIGLTIAADLLNKVVLYTPNVIAALFILILGMFLATLLRNIVQVTANNIGLAQSKILSKLVEIIAIVFAIIVALEQLQIAVNVTHITLSIILGSVGFGFALAFGLGCKDIAGKFVSEFIEKLKRK
jgi:hypothetical protein